MFSGESRDPKPSQEKRIREIAFIEIEDSECGCRGWRVRVTEESIVSTSNYLFDSFQDALTSSSFKEESADDPID